jgi:hypothetical protein
MKRLSVRLLIAFLTFALGVGSVFYWLSHRRGSPPMTQSPSAQLTDRKNNEQRVAATVEQEMPQSIDEYFSESDTIKHGEFEISKVSKVRTEVDEGRSTKVDVRSVEVKRRQRTVAKFDGVYYPLGNAANFALFPLLGGEDKQLIVSLTVPRGGRHWVATFSPKFQIIYDSARGGVDREEFQIIDLDKDGVYEILQYVIDFYAWENITMAETPLPVVVFKYDRRSKRYLPANPDFADYVLHGIEDEIQKLDPNDQERYFSRRLDIALRYIFAGRENDGWAFFDRAYQRPDLRQVKLKIKRILDDNLAYRHLYRRGRNH